MPVQDDNLTKSSEDTARPEPPAVSRRALLRAGTTVMPVVLTLQSGAALARSSNLISAAPAGTRDGNGDAICLDTSYLGEPVNESSYDLGEPASGSVNVIAGHREYFTADNRSPESKIGIDDACHRGGALYYHESGWHEVRLPTNGVIVSANALNSVSGHGQVLMKYIG